MEHNGDFQITGTMSDYLVNELENEADGQKYATEYLKASFLTAVPISLFTLRREAGLTQAQVAERLHTKQSAIARMEADFDGAMSLRRYVDFALACGCIPHDPTYTPIEIARNFTIAQPETPLTFANQANWSNPTFQLGLEPKVTIVQTTSIVPLPATTLQEAGPQLHFHNTPVVFDINRATTVQEDKKQLSLADVRSQKLPLQESAAA